MFVALSIGILTALTGTGLSQVAPAFADKEECEDNDDNNCNERTHKIKQDDNCKAENEYEKIGSIGSTTNNNDFVCTNILTSPANGDDNEFGDSALVSGYGVALVIGNDTSLPTIPFFFS